MTNATPAEADGSAVAYSPSAGAASAPAEADAAAVAYSPSTASGAQPAEADGSGAAYSPSPAIAMTAGSASASATPGLAVASPASTPAAATATAVVNQPIPYVIRPPIMRSTFIQPSLNPSFPTISWTQAQFAADFAWMTSCGIHEVIVQWTVDQDANQSYFPVGATTLPPQYNSMLSNLLNAAQAAGVKVWLGLCNTYNWQTHASDNTWLYNQFYLNTVAATQLYGLYAGMFKGWYISNEVNDALLSTPANVAPMTAFFANHVAWMSTNAGNLPIMTSPTYENLTQTPTQFASSCSSVFSGINVLNVQDSGGSGYIGPGQINSYFSLLQSVFFGTTTQLWQNADMFTPGGVMSPVQLQADLGATVGMCSGYSGFSFITQMDPNILGSAAIWTQYRAYARQYFGATDVSADSGTAVARGYAAPIYRSDPKRTYIVEPVSRTLFIPQRSRIIVV